MRPIVVVRLWREGMFQRVTCYTFSDLEEALAVADPGSPVVVEWRPS